MREVEWHHNDQEAATTTTTASPARANYDFTRLRPYEAAKATKEKIVTRWL
jgi:hypothetical protein